jgi:hypothetical protein
MPISKKSDRSGAFRGNPARPAPPPPPEYTSQTQTQTQTNPKVFRRSDRNANPEDLDTEITDWYTTVVNSLQKLSVQGSPEGSVRQRVEGSVRPRTLPEKKWLDKVEYERYKKALDNQRTDLVKINEQRREYIAKNPLPKLDTDFAYPIDGGEYNYEENLSDGNCFYYSVIRAMERKAFPDGRHITNSKVRKAINSLLTPDAVRIFKKKITEALPQNKDLMDQLSFKIVDERKVQDKLTGDYVWAEDVSIQATANYLNCCIYVFVPKGFHSSFESPQPIPIRDSWEVYFPDNHSSGPSRAEKMFSLNNPEMGAIVQPIRGKYPLTEQSKIKINDLKYSIEDIRPYVSSKEINRAHEDYVHNEQKFREVTKEKYLEEFKKLNDNKCIDENNSIYVMFKKEGHFVYIEHKNSISDPVNENLKKNLKEKYEELERELLIDLSKELKEKLLEGTTNVIRRRDVITLINDINTKKMLRDSLSLQGRNRSKKARQSRQNQKNKSGKHGKQSKQGNKRRKSSKKKKKK